MTLRSQIRRVTVDRVDLPLTEPFGISGGGHAIAKNVLVTIELGDGTLGYGEAAPLPPFNGETQDLALDALHRATPLLEGADVRQWRSVARSVRQATVGVGSAQCAIETAVVDAFARQAGVPLWAFFGGSSFRLDTDFTIPINSIDPATAVAHAARSARDIAARGFRVIKTKVGGSSATLDLNRLEAIHEAAPGLAIILDANGGFDAPTALAFLDDLQRRNIVPLLFEQPVAKADLDGMAVVTARSGIPIIADESADGLAAVVELIKRRAATGVNIKLMKCGIIEALDIATLCRAAGFELMIGGMVESILAMSVSACFAAGIGGFTYADLDTPLFVAENPFRGGFQITGCEIDVRSIEAGHGVEPKAALVTR